MAEESKKSALPASAKPPSPQVQRLLDRRENLVYRHDQILSKQESSEAHDIETAKTRTQNMITEIDQELKRLGWKQ